MEKQELVDKAAETLRPFETENLIDSIQHLDITKIFSHPAILLILAAVFFFGVIRRSKPVLLTLFSLLCIAMIIRYAMPAPGDELTLSSTLPFIGGGMLIGIVIIYFSVVKSD